MSELKKGDLVIPNAWAYKVVKVLDDGNVILRKGQEGVSGSYTTKKHQNDLIRLERHIMSDQDPKYNPSDPVVITDEGRLGTIKKIVGRREDGTWLYELSIFDSKVYAEDKIQTYTPQEDPLFGKEAPKPEQESTFNSAFKS